MYILHDAVGYQLKELSKFPRENEVLLPGVVQFRVKSATRYDDTHSL